MTRCRLASVLVVGLFACGPSAVPRQTTPPASETSKPLLPPASSASAPSAAQAATAAEAVVVAPTAAPKHGRLSLGGTASLVIYPNGEVYAWGGAAVFNIFGEGKSKRPKAEAVEKLRGIQDYSLNEMHGCARYPDGHAKCFGVFVKPDPTDLQDVESLDARGSSPCAVRMGGKLFCGREKKPVLEGVQAVSVGAADGDSNLGERLCVIRTNATIWCRGVRFGRVWEYNEREGFEPSTTEIPIEIRGFHDVTSFVNGGRHGCAIVPSGEVYCIGFGEHGQFGNGKFGAPYAEIKPIAARGVTNAMEVALGDDFTLVLRKDGTVMAFGGNDNGQLGLGDRKQRTIPEAIAGLEHVVHIAASHSHACALHENGAVSCWGENNFGQVGMGSAGLPIKVPTAVVGLPPAK